MPANVSTVTFGGQRCIVPDPWAWPACAWKANSYTCPTGRQHGTAWVLLERRAVTALYPNAAAKKNPQILTFFDTAQGVQVAIPGLYLSRCHKVTQSAPNAAGALYLLELVDVRWHAAKFSYIDLLANLRKNCFVPESPTDADLYHADSLNAGAAWTWQALIGEIWSQLPAGLGPLPTLPTTLPAEDPDNIRLVGASAWDALHDVLEKLGWTTAMDPTGPTIKIVEVGAVQPGLQAAENAIRFHLHDSDPLEGDVCVIPATVRVYFRRRVSLATTADDLLLSGWHAVDSATGVAGALTGTVVSVWDDMTADFAAGGGGPTNNTELSARATEIRTAWVKAQQDRKGTTYGGVVKTVLPGEQISEVCWHQFSAEEGVRTRTRRSPLWGKGWCGNGPTVGGCATTGEDVRRVALGKLDGTLAAGGSATVSVWAGGAGSEEDTDENVTASDWLGLSGDEDDEVIVALIGCSWYILNVKKRSLCDFIETMEDYDSEATQFVSHKAGEGDACLKWVTGEECPEPPPPEE